MLDHTVQRTWRHWYPSCGFAGTAWQYGPVGGLLSVLLLTSCGGGGEGDPAPGEVLRSDGGTVLVNAEPGGGGMAGVGFFGRVRLVGDCLGIAHATIIWPHGTEIVSGEPLVIEVPGMGKVGVGDRVSGGGDEYVDYLPDGIEAIPPGCSEGSVFAFYPDR